MSNIQERETLKEIHDDVEQIRKEVHELSVTKQDKVKPAAYIAFIIFLFTQTLSAVWWASELTTGLATLTERVADLNVDRFYGKDGVQLKTIIDIEISNLSRQVAEMKAEVRDLEAAVNNNINRIAAIKAEQISCSRRLAEHERQSNESSE